MEAEGLLAEASKAKLARDALAGRRAQYEQARGLHRTRGRGRGRPRPRQLCLTWRSSRAGSRACLLALLPTAVPEPQRRLTHVPAAPPNAHALSCEGGVARLRPGGARGAGAAQGAGLACAQWPA